MTVNTGVDTNQYVVFKLDKEEFGIDIRTVTTIERMSQITRVPKTDEFVRGVISLRGEVIPIIDLRNKFKLDEIEYTEEARIIVVKVKDIVLGIIVDMVSEVVTIQNSNVENPNGITNDNLLNYISGIGKIGNRIVTLLNLKNVVTNS